MHRVLPKLLLALVVVVASPASAASTGGSGGPLTDRTFLSFYDSASGYTSDYHLYAAGLDWSKPVGLLVYADGSGEYGLKNPGSTYLLAGTNGLINVAKRNNMVLLTPFSPNKACADGDGSCWYQGDPPGYTRWAEALVKRVQSQYPIETDRVAFGGYSSGAQLATEYWVPSGAAQRTMTDGVVVAISYGGSPKVTASISEAFRTRVHMNWNTGDKDTAYTTTSSYGVKAGYAWYTDRAFQTSLDVIAGLGHSRSDFGLVMERQIKEHVPAGSTTTPPPTLAGLLEGEDMAWQYGTYDVYSDSTASGGYKYVFWTNGGSAGTLNASTSFNTLELRGKADFYGSAYPQGRVTVDGVVVGTVSFDSESWQTKTLTGNWAAGSHTVRVEYTNDSSYRGLILDVIRAMAK
ncbi:hypothetical protein JQX13_31485 [Archangium violaceum]|uniref:carbohydrate-binding domain-containing protein n=1 Tax=Archangium violaceum TaxID=83451 RepID=UPI00193C7C77|nr:carbohydrate-binding domain-containing protein [Archangium violaceum]QRK04738.1 hypothetical protein JQX13_31485 [Archangium violaceum]